MAAIRKRGKSYAIEISNGYDESGTICDERITLTKFIKECCLPEYAEGSLKEDTLSAYKDDINRYIIPKLGNRRLISIRGNDISGFYLELLRTPKQNGSGTLSVSTVRHIGSVLGSIFRRAVMWEYIS